MDAVVCLAVLRMLVIRDLHQFGNDQPLFYGLGFAVLAFFVLEMCVKLAALGGRGFWRRGAGR